MLSQIATVAILSLVSGLPYGYYNHNPYSYSPANYNNYQRLDYQRSSPYTSNRNHPINISNNNNNINNNNLPEPSRQSEPALADDGFSSGFSGVSGLAKIGSNIPSILN